MVNIVLFGPPGAGKGTQAALLVDKYDFHHISTGEVIRREIESGSELGSSMKDYIARGEFAPDDVVIGMVAKYLEENSDSPGNIFDGFPRTTAQAEVFDKMMQLNGTPLDVMISLEVPEETLVKRLLHRGKDSGRPDDSDEAVIRHRIEIYEKVTAAVSEYYAAKGKHIAVDGSGTVEEIFQRLCKEVDSLM